MDGDGSRDVVRLRWLHRSASQPFHGSLGVSVHFARGGVGRIAVHIAGWLDMAHPARPSVPASTTAQLDGVPGRELIVNFWNTPASFAGYRVIADHGGRLVSIPAPGGDPMHGWWVGASVGTGGQTYACPTGRVVKIVSSGMQHPGPVHTTRTSYMWRDGGWRLVRTVHTVGAGGAGDWVCSWLADWGG
jgi:hypothetical protein